MTLRSWIDSQIVSEAELAAALRGFGTPTLNFKDRQDGQWLEIKEITHEMARDTTGAIVYIPNKEIWTNFIATVDVLPNVGNVSAGSVKLWVLDERYGLQTQYFADAADTPAATSHQNVFAMGLGFYSNTEDRDGYITNHIGMPIQRWWGCRRNGFYFGEDWDVGDSGTFAAVYEYDRIAVI